MGCANSTFVLPCPMGHWGGAKRSDITILITKSISTIFIPNFVCFLTYKRYKTYRTGLVFSVRRLGHTLGCDLGCFGVTNLLFPNTILWHIKLMEMCLEQDTNKKFHPSSKLVTLGRGQKVKYSYISSKA